MNGILITAQGVFELPPIKIDLDAPLPTTLYGIPVTHKVKAIQSKANPVGNRKQRRAAAAMSR